jgi:hypothetical protein
MPVAPQSATVWTPLLTGALRTHAEAVVGEIAAALAGPSAILDLQGGSLGAGWAGLGLFHLAFAQHTGSGEDLDRAERWMDRATDSLAEVSLPPSLYGGFLGVGWAVELMLRAQAGGEDLNGELDEALLGLLDQSPWQGHYDLIEGLVGHGVYGLARIHRPLGPALMAKVVLRLEELARTESGGVTWATPPRLLPPWQRARHAQGHYDLGLAHGIPGILALLGHAIASGVEPERAARLLEGGITWLLARRNPSGLGSCFGTAVPVERPEARDTSRVAWCYGDLGISVALLGAARRADRPEWEREALDIARRAAGRGGEDAGVADAALCHGAAGNAHLFNRLHQATGEALFRDAALDWFQRVLAFHQSGRGVGGFFAYAPDLDDATRDPWAPVPGLLEGAAGIGLALLAALDPVEPAWDQMLLADLPAAMALKDRRGP